MATNPKGTFHELSISLRQHRRTQKKSVKFLQLYEPIIRKALQAYRVDHEVEVCFDRSPLLDYSRNKRKRRDEVVIFLKVGGEEEWAEDPKTFDRITKRKFRALLRPGLIEVGLETIPIRIELQAATQWGTPVHLLR
jgi:hypothetical protein